MARGVLAAVLAEKQDRQGQVLAVQEGEPGQLRLVAQAATMEVMGRRTPVVPVGLQSSIAAPVEVAAADASAAAAADVFWIRPAAAAEAGQASSQVQIPNKSQGVPPQVRTPQTLATLIIWLLRV